MKRKDTIDKLIANKSFAEDDREWLESLEDARFDKVVALSETEEEEDKGKNKDEDLDTNKDKNKNKKDEGKDANIDTNADTDEEDVDVDNMDVNSYLETAKMPSGMKEVLKSGYKVLEDKRTMHINRILKVENSKFTKESLAKKSLDELEAISSLIPVEEGEYTPDFSANAGGKESSGKVININERQEDGSGVPIPPTPKWKDGKPVVNEEG